MAHPSSAALAGSILGHLQQVEGERRARGAEPALAARAKALKAYQRDRFARTHADLLAHPRYAAAARFFLDDLYGPQDFAERDAQFARIVPALVRLFPHEVVTTVDALAELHALSETLDSAMSRHLGSDEVDATTYQAAWQATGRAADRSRQVALVVSLGQQLDRYTRNRLLRHSLKLMRGPAKAAGLSSLQSFLERGFDTFGAMGGSTDFLRLIEQRERALMQALFDGAAVADATSPTASLGQLP